MREITVDFMAKETMRLRAVILQKPLYHPSGVRLHSAGELVTPELARAMKEIGMDKLYLLEPGETELKALGALGTERVAPRELVEGDVLAEDISGLDGCILVPAGQVLDAVWLARARGTGAASVAIRRRGSEAAQKQARDYLATRPQAAPKGRAFDERVTETFRASLIKVRPLMIPLGRVAVGFRDEFLRAMTVNTLAGAGHEATWWEPSPAGLDKLKSWRPDVLLLELETARGICGAVRQVETLWSMGIIVCAEEGRKADVLKALEEGANESIHRPPTPELLLQKVAGCMQAMGRSVGLRPSILMERRKEPRRPVQAACGLKDPFLSKPLPVTSATLTEIGADGARIEYGRPGWPCLHAYTPHGVHPKHFFYGYAKANPLGRDLIMTFPPGIPGPPERYAKVSHLELAGAFERAGLVFQRGTASTRR